MTKVRAPSPCRVRVSWSARVPARAAGAAELALNSELPAPAARALYRSAWPAVVAVRVVQSSLPLGGWIQPSLLRNALA
eukprot:CAMPEP_0185186308 /NCGR_PEP_ID=MMETSP1140-20130426/3950_1 /TAXON_ID=298111 /ORGANISM="Pavlova sp., Strain CCMP459" /LENGTH=78 /DNA_ID=CAMNT_0027752589 /DNA_START=274 /DNA_END=510 /DNA_ORIENTATION=+